MSLPSLCPKALLGLSSQPVASEQAQPFRGSNQPVGRCVVNLSSTNPSTNTDQSHSSQNQAPGKKPKNKIPRGILSGDEASRLPRRSFLSSITTASLANLTSLIPGSTLFSGEALAENARLEDVDFRELQQALEAAISGELEVAEGLFGKLIETNPESASMWSNRGSVRLSLEKYEEAVGDFSKAIDLAPYAAVPFLNRAIAFEALGKLDEAAEDCFSAIKNDPHESAALFNLGNVEVKRLRFKEALDAYQMAADLSPGIAGYRLREANVLFQVGFATDAEKLVRSIVRKYPNYAEAHAALAGMLWGEGSISLAEEQLTEATEWEPNFKNFSWVSDNVQWPPKLLQTYEKFLTLN